MRAQLVPVDGGHPIDIVKDLIVVGRKEDCDVRLEHKSVSKMHCVIVKTDGLLLLRDLGSTNGTRVNGTRVRRAALLPNDQVGIAHFKFRVFLGPDEPAPPAQPHEHTQALDRDELQQALKGGRPAGGTEKASPREAAAVEPLHRNLLPDVYPDEPSSEK
jgi:pSer/pThr/pTyr-binding forkhead associated (FHA) protein